MRDGVVILVGILAAGLVEPAASSAASEGAADRIEVDDRTGEIALVIGEQRVIASEDVESFSESTKGVIEVKVPRDGRRLVVTAIKAGQTSLLLIERGGRERSLVISVFARRPETIEAELAQLLGDTPGVRLRRIGARIFIDGVLPSEAELARAAQIAKMYPGQVESVAQIDPAVVRPRSNIRFDLVFIEMRASSGWGMGVNWPAQLGGTQSFDLSWELGGAAPSASYQIVDQALPFLEAASEAGFAKIRKRASLLTTSGNRATYSAGGEVNVAIEGSAAAELRSIPYGCTLTVLPRLDPGPGLLDLEVEAEVSDLSETVADVPGRTISKVATLVHLGLGQSIVLSGLDAESEKRSKSGLPGLSRIPIFGMLFGVHRSREERVEGLIAITPAVIDNVGRDGKRQLEEALAEFAEFDG
jgi:pilus assembly protein CpaC